MHKSCILYIVIKVICQLSKFLHRIKEKGKALSGIVFLFPSENEAGFLASCSSIINRIVFSNYTSFWRSLISTTASQDLKNHWPGGRYTVSARPTLCVLQGSGGIPSFFEVSRSLANCFNGAAAVSKNHYFCKKGHAGTLSYISSLLLFLTNL